MKTTAAIKSKKSRKLQTEPGSSFVKYFKRNYDYYLLLLPGAVLLLLFRFCPLYGITTAFKDFNILKGLNASPWVGLKWFKQLFSSPDFFSILRNSVTISVLELIFVFPAPIILAVLLNELKNERFKKIVQSVSYLPHFLSWVIVGGFIIQFLQPYTGPVSYIFAALGIEPRMLLLNKNWFYPILLAGDIWKGVGWGTILYLAALAGIDVEQYEAAFVDGASRGQRIWHITLPGILPVIILMLILRVGNILHAGFEQIFAMYNPAVYDVADIIDTYVYRKGLGQMDFSLGTALGLFNSVVAFVLITTSNYISRRFSGKGIW